MFPSGGTLNQLIRLVVRTSVSVRDLHTTVLRLLGVDHEQFTCKYQDLNQKLTEVELAQVIEVLMA